MDSPDANFWKVAIKKELEAHQANHTWELVELPAHKRAIGCRWVFNIKDNTTPPMFKGRLVAQGFKQIQGVDYGETFSPVIRYESIRILFALAAQFKLAVHQMDVTTAFLNGDLQEEIYMKVPDGVDAPANKVCRLRKSLYGLKQAPLCWNIKINDVMLAAGFKRSLSEFGLYSKVVDAEVVLVALYVDDLLILSNNVALINQVKLLLNSSFKMKDLGVVNTFLGMEISQTSNGISLHLNKYFNNMLQDFGMTECNAVSTPLPSNINAIDDGSRLLESDATAFRSMVGKLLFAANTVRTDLAFAASYLSRFIKDPHTKHLSACKHTLRYIKGTTKLGLMFREGSEFELVGYCDADWAGDKVDRKSMTGYLFKLGNSIITWKCKKQQTIALSSTEAEYMALGDAVKEALWIRQLLKGLGLKGKAASTIYEDNEGCKMLSEHPIHHQRTKHIDIRHHFIRDHIQKNEVEIKSISTNYMIADMLTKSLNQ